ncbi:DUF418 domain-containing protein [Flagellimonas sp. S174]|uniref:DUF418 domain-containing protein n=1 Tax=Flagellimonas sp. S174 TaxID=3410790 RepID=UPI003BF5C30C
MTSFKKPSTRIIGLDVARALALFGMIVVNFKMVFGAKDSSGIIRVINLLDGKAAATFVVLAGVGMALITKKANKTNDLKEWTSIKKKILKRAILLFLIGVSYITIWPADILHFYGVYMIVVIVLLKRTERSILLFGFGLIFIYPFLMMLWDYEMGWDFNSLTYNDFWTIRGFTRNLIYNGFHPVIPWSAFMVFGYWLGKQDLQNVKFVKKLLLFSILAFVVVQITSSVLINLLSGISPQTSKEIKELFGTSPMPPLPIYMLNGVAIAFTIISASILIIGANKKNRIAVALAKTGQLALTFYVAHVILGMGIVESINPDKIGQYPLLFSVGYALVFSFSCVLFAWVWLKYNSIGPLEWIFRRITK